MRLRIGVVGLGDQWEDRYQPALTALSDRFEVRAVYAPVTWIAKQVARRWNIEPSLGFQAMVRRSDIDAILVLSAEWHGILPILAACEAAKAVYCCADLDVDLAQANRIRDHVDQSGVAFVTELPRRHSPATLRLKELLATQLGPPELVFCTERLSRPVGGQQPPLASQATSSTRCLIEMVDWCRFVVGGEPASVVGVEHRCHQDAAEQAALGDYRLLGLEFPCSNLASTPVVAQLTCGRYIPDSWPEAVSFRPPSQLQVVCQRGTAFVDLPHTITWFDEAGRHMESLASERPLGEQMLMHFHRAVTSLVRRTNELQDAYTAIRIVVAGERSYRDGRRIML